MAQLKGSTYFSLKGGLNTEASPLNIPPTDATDIGNVDINIDGSIERRRSFDFIGAENSKTSNIADYTDLGSEVSSIGQFNPVDSDGNIVKFVIAHIGTQFHIYDYSTPGYLEYIDNPHTTITSSFDNKQSTFKTTFLPEGNRCFIVNGYHPLGYIEYTASTDSFAFTRLNAQQRVDSGSAAPISDIIADDSGWLVGTMSSSRLWLAGASGYPNTVFFSQTIVAGVGYNKMYQAADPYSVSDNLLVDTDGGSIVLTGAERILAIAPLGSGVIVFANNGVWSIAGQDGFRATSYSINKISSAGIIGSFGWAEVEQQLIYFGQNDVYTILLGTAIDTPEVKPVGNKIVKFYTSIPRYNRASGKAVYDSEKKKLYFFCNFSGLDWHKELNPNTQPTFLRDCLVFDVRLAAWTKYSLETDSDGSKIAFGDVGVFDGGLPTTESVVDSTSDPVTDSTGDPVIIQSRVASNASYSLTTMFIKKNGTSYDVSFGYQTPAGLVDFAASATNSTSYTSFVTLANQVFNDVGHRKFAPYIIPLFKRIESGELDSSGIDITPGGCNYRVDWNWSISNDSEQFGTLRPAYFPDRYTLSKFDGAPTGRNLVTARLKVRGRGDVFRLHFESDGDKDFKLYGWQVMVHAKARI